MIIGGQLRAHIASSTTPTSTRANPLDNGIPHHAPGVSVGGLLGLLRWSMLIPVDSALCSSHPPTQPNCSRVAGFRIEHLSSPHLPHSDAEQDLSTRVSSPVAEVGSGTFTHLPRAVPTLCSLLAWMSNWVFASTG